MLGIDNDPGYLDNRACSYDETTKYKLRELFSVRRQKAEPIDFNVKNAETWDDVGSKSLQLYLELERIQDNADVGEQVQIIKTKAGLLERLNAVGDKALSHKHVAEFMTTVMDIMAESLTQEQRIHIMDKLGEYK